MNRLSGNRSQVRGVTLCERFLGDVSGIIGVVPPSSNAAPVSRPSRPERQRGMAAQARRVASWMAVTFESGFWYPPARFHAKGVCCSKAASNTT